MSDIGTHVVEFDFGFFELLSRDVLSAPLDAVDGEAPLVSVVRGGVRIRTGAYMGRATAQILDRKPSESEGYAGWDSAGECTAEFTHRELVLANPGRDDDDLDTTIRARPGIHRVRVHARGQAEYFDGVATDPTIEQYLIEIWRDDTPPTRIAHSKPNPTAASMDTADGVKVGSVSVKGPGSSIAGGEWAQGRDGRQ